MTLVVAVGCSDGVVMAADSASTDAETGIKQPSEKIFPLAGQRIIYGGSGDVGLFQKLQADISGFSQKATLAETRRALQRKIVPILKHAVEMHVPIREPGFHTPPTATLLFAGLTQEKTPWILEIERDARDTVYGDDLGNFAAIGSGKPLAQAIFRPHLPAERDVDKGKLLAHRVVCDAISLASHSLALPVQMYVLRVGCSAPEKIEEDEMNRLADSCELWRNIERESLDKALAPATGDKAEAKLPEPEEAEEE
jgi:proteasome beta subunit